MRLGQLATRATLGGLAMHRLPLHNATTSLSARQACDFGYKICGDGCIPITGECCDGYAMLSFHGHNL